MSLRRMRPEQRRDFKAELSRNTNALLRPKDTQNSPDQEPRKGGIPQERIGLFS